MKPQQCVQNFAALYKIFDTELVALSTSAHIGHASTSIVSDTQTTRCFSFFSTELVVAFLFTAFLWLYSGREVAVFVM